MARYLLDTDICIYVIKARDPALLGLFNTHSTELAISAVTLAELYYGAGKSSQPERSRGIVQEFCGRLEHIPLDSKAAEHAGEIRADLARAGTPIGPYDVMIAGIARANGLILVTNNTREFSRVSALRLENWVSN